jgi:hypothetical protein
LVAADRPLTFTTFPEKLPFAGYWLRDEARTTPNPQPIDVMLGDRWLVKKVHGSIPGIYVSVGWRGSSCM